MKQGEKGQIAWLIQEGEVDVFMESPGGMRKLARLNSNHVVGEMSLIDSGLRTATVVARTPVTATEIRRELFDRMLDTCEPLARHMLSHLVNAVRTSRGVDIIQPTVIGPTIRSTEDSTRILERRMFAPNTTIFRENDTGEAAYLIQSGKVMIVKEERVIAALGPGRTFGEMALLKNVKRMAGAVVSDEGAAVEIIRRREFDTAVNSMPKVLRSLTHAYLNYLADEKG